MWWKDLKNIQEFGACGMCSKVGVKMYWPRRGHTAFNEIRGHCVSFGLHNSQIMCCRNIGCNQIPLHLLPFAKVFPRYLLKVLVMVVGGHGGLSCMRKAYCFRRTLGSCILSSFWALWDPRWIYAPSSQVSTSISILGFTAIFCLTEYTVVKHVPYFPRNNILWLILEM